LLTLVPVQNRIEAEAAAEAPVTAQLLTVPAPIPAQDHGSSHVASQQSPQRSLPVEKDGRRLQLDIARLVAVQAQAHYTSLFDGETIWFCPYRQSRSGCFGQTRRRFGCRRHGRQNSLSSAGQPVAPVLAEAAARRTGDRRVTAANTADPLTQFVQRDRHSCTEPPFRAASIVAAAHPFLSSEQREELLPNRQPVPRRKQIDPGTLYLPPPVQRC
ncbi:MAG: hypothetical protein J0626_07475, partial [Rhodospirillaceae bacterium]|nr:hypothetical protein [Rhodospirillaceae bacterium]